LNPGDRLTHGGRCILIPEERRDRILDMIKEHKVCSVKKLVSEGEGAPE